MSLINYTIKTKDNQLKYVSRRNFTHLTKQQRENIASYFELGYSKTKIAKLVGVHRTTIVRELKRGTFRYKVDTNGSHYRYEPEYAQYKANDNLKKSKRKPIHSSESPFIKLITKLVNTLNCSILAAHSFIVRHRNEIEVLKDQSIVSVPTLYKYAHKGILKLKKQAFPYGLKTKGQNKTKEAKMIQKGDNIALRPEEANNRSEFGHWEGDLVLGSKKGSKECLLTLVERQTRAFIALKIKDKTNESVQNAFDQLERKLGQQLFKLIIKTITFDNGKEFVRFNELERSIFGSEKRFKVYYANPYHSWERGSNENSNRWIRRYFPKGTDFSKITQGEINKAISKINYTIRRKLNFKSSAELLNELNIPLLDLLDIKNPYYKLKLILGFSL